MSATLEKRFRPRPPGCAVLGVIAVENDGKRNPGCDPFVQHEHDGVAVAGKLELEVCDLVLELLHVLLCRHVQVARSTLIENGAAGGLDSPLLGEASVIVTPSPEDDEGCCLTGFLEQLNFVVQPGMYPSSEKHEFLSVDNLGVVKTCSQCASPSRRLRLESFDRYPVLDELLLEPVETYCLYRSKDTTCFEIIFGHALGGSR